MKFSSTQSFKGINKGYITDLMKLQKDLVRFSTAETEHDKMYWEGKAHKLWWQESQIIKSCGELVANITLVLMQYEQFEPSMLSEIYESLNKED